MRRRMMGEDDPIFSNAISVLHFDVKDNVDAKSNSIVWNSTPSFVPGRFGNALSPGMCTVNLPVSTNKPSTFTIGCWVKTFNEKGNGYCSVRVNQDRYDMPCSIGFNVGYSTPGSVRILIGNGGTGWADSMTLLGNIPMDSDYHYFEMTYNNGVITSFVDGIKYGTITRTLPTMTDYKKIGVTAGNISYIDEVIYTPEILHTENFTPPSKPYR